MFVSLKFSYQSKIKSGRLTQNTLDQQKMREKESEERENRLLTSQTRAPPVK